MERLRRLFAQPIVRDAMLWWLGSRLAILCILVFVMLVFPDRLVPRPLHLYDAEFYTDIADNGYKWNGDRMQKQNVGFFPLLPIVMRLIAVGGVPSDIGATVLNNLLLLATLMALGHLRGMSLSRRELNLLYFLLCFHPSSFYFSIPYTETLFLALAVMIFLTAERGRIATCVILCFLAGLVRSNGWLCAAALVLASFCDAARCGVRWREFRLPLLAAAAGAAGTLSFLLYCHFQLGDFLATVHAQRAWGHQSLRYHQAIVSSITGIVHTGGLMYWRILLDALWLVAALPIALGAWTSGRFSRPIAIFGILATAFPLIMLGGDEVRSTIRYQMVIFPTLAMLAIWCARSKWLVGIVGCLWIGLFAFFTGRVLLGEWVQ